MTVPEICIEVTGDVPRNTHAIVIEASAFTFVDSVNQLPRDQGKMPWKRLVVCNRACREATLGWAARDAPFRNCVLGTPSPELPGWWYRIAFARTPVEVHVMQKGFVLSHLTRWVLKLVVRRRKQCRLGEANLQIEHPVRTFNLGCILLVARRITL
jgi:hypothetical protein